MERPKIFDETINKKSFSRNRSTIPYEHGFLSQENRVFVENTINDLKQSKSPAGYDGTPIIKEQFDFEKLYPGLTFKSSDLLYDRMMNDARNVFPRNRDLKVRVNTYYEDAIKINLNNIYHFAPRFFADNFFTKTGVNNTGFEAYQVYIYLLCFIHFTDEHRDDIDIRELENIDKILSWIATRRDPSIPYLIQGPTSNANIVSNDFRVHYKTLIDASNEMSEIIAYNQLSSTQTISSDLYKLMNIITNMPNVYFKNPDEARKYNINIDSSQGVKVKIDNQMNLIFDCNYVNLGDVTEQNKLARFQDLDSIITNNKVNSMINTKKLAELFHNYSRIKILELVFTPDTYISSLDAFAKVFVVFKGVSCSERNVYNTIETNFLKIGGKFTKTNRGYEFKMDVDAITYKSVLADVKTFEIYLTLDPSVSNKIVPNEYSLVIQKNKIYNHPITTDVIYDAKVRGQKKMVTVIKQVQADKGNDENVSFWRKIDLIQLLGIDYGNMQENLIVNNKFLPNITQEYYLKQLKRTGLRNETLADRLFSTFVNKSFRNILDLLRKIREYVDNTYIIDLLNKLSKLVNRLDISENLSTYIDKIVAKLTINEALDSIEKEIVDLAIVNNYEFIQGEDRGNIVNFINDSNYTPAGLASRSEDVVKFIVMSDKLLNTSEKFNIYYDVSNPKYQPLIDAAFSRTCECDTDTLISKLFEFDQSGIKYSNAEKEYMKDLINRYNSLTPDELYLINVLNTDIGNKILSGQSITEEEKNTILSSFGIYLNYEYEKSQILNEINESKESWSLPEYENILKNIINRSLLISTQEKQDLIKRITTPQIDEYFKPTILKIINVDSNLITLDSLNNYNKPFNNKNDLINNLEKYVSAAELMENPASNLSQLKEIFDNYEENNNENERKIGNNRNSILSNIITFIVNLNNFNLFIGTVLSFEFITTSFDYITFFTNSKNSLEQTGYDTSKYIAAYTDFVENINFINVEWSKYFKNILSSIINIFPENYDNYDLVSNVSAILTVETTFIKNYIKLYNSLGYIKKNVDRQEQILYELVEVDTTNATINGKYFKVDANGFATLDGTEPDPNYLIYTEEENDLALINLYRKFNDEIKNVKRGSFLYSESLGMIQNLTDILLDYVHSENIYKFDNSYILNEDNEMYYEYHDINNYGVIVSANFNGEIKLNDFTYYNYAYPVDTLTSFRILDNLAWDKQTNIYNIEITAVSSTTAETINIIGDFIKHTNDSNFYFIGMIQNGVSKNRLLTASYNYSNEAWEFEDYKIVNSLNGDINVITYRDILGHMITLDDEFNVVFSKMDTIKTLNDFMNYPDTVFDDNCYTITFIARDDEILLSLIYKYYQIKNELHIIAQYKADEVIKEYCTVIDLTNMIIYDSLNVVNTSFGKLGIQVVVINGTCIVNGEDANIVSDYATEPNKDKSNLFKAFRIDSIDVKSDYWNKTAFISSLMLCPVESCIKEYPTTEYINFDNEIVYNGETDGKILYGYEPTFNIFKGTYKITSKDIYVYEDSFVSSGLNYLYVNMNEEVTYYLQDEITKEVDLSQSSETIIATLYKLPKLDSTATVSLELYNDKITKVTVTIGNDTNSYEGTIYSGYPVYLPVCNDRYEFVASYSVTGDYGINTFTFSDITLTTVSYETIVYKKTKNGMQIRNIKTLRYSNVPSKYAQRSDILFSLFGDYKTTFKLHPLFKYAENLLVVPRYIDSNKRFIMVAEKYNQNLMTKPVYLRSQYDLNSSTKNTIRDSDTVIYKIFPTSDPNKTHLMESINKDLIMIGSVSNTGLIQDVAINAANVHAIPSSSRMMLSLEFS